jgi:hypothetical protein
VFVSKFVSIGVLPPATPKLVPLWQSSGRPSNPRSNAWPALAQIVSRIVNAWRAAAGRAFVRQSAAAPQAENRFSEVMAPTAARRRLRTDQTR